MLNTEGNASQQSRYIWQTGTLLCLKFCVTFEAQIVIFKHNIGTITMFLYRKASFETSTGSNGENGCLREKSMMLFG